MEPIACSLEADQLSERLAAIREIGREALLASDGRVLRFRPDRQVRTRLEAIVEAESRCCPFLRLDLSEHGDELVLTVDAPEEGAPVARDLAAAFGA